MFPEQNQLRDIIVILMDGSQLILQSSRLTRKSSLTSVPLLVDADSIIVELLLTLEAAQFDIQINEQKKNDEKEILNIYKEALISIKRRFAEVNKVNIKLQNVLKVIANSENDDVATLKEIAQVTIRQTDLTDRSGKENISAGIDIHLL